MTARDEVLARISAALAPVRGQAPGAGKVSDPAAIPRRYRRAGAVTPGDPAGGAPGDAARRARSADLLIDRLIDYRATVTRCEPAGVAAVLAQRLSQHRIDSVLVPDGFPERWLTDTGAERRTDDALTPVQLDRIDGVLCTCALAIAETGTIVLDAGPGQGRRALSLVPDYLLIVVDSEQVVAGVPEAVAQLDPGRPLTWISGPSATSDIELHRVEGVHGPRTLDVILIDPAGDPTA